MTSKNISLNFGANLITSNGADTNSKMTENYNKMVMQLFLTTMTYLHRKKKKPIKKFVFIIIISNIIIK